MSGSTAVVPVVIVGGGPCGLAAAVSMKQAGIDAVVLEAGCVVNSIMGYPTYISFFSTAEKLSIGMPFVVSTEKPTRRDALAYYRAVVRHFDLAVRQYEAVTRIEPRDGLFVVHSAPRGLGPQETKARAVIVATGYFGTPNRLDVPGEDLPHVTHEYREGHEAFQRTALVVGGGNSAVEAALDLYRAGAKVTVVHFGPTFDKNIKPWVRPDFEGRVADGDIALHWNTRVTAITPDAVLVERNDVAERIAAQHVYLMTGYTPRPELLASVGTSLDPVTGVPPHDPKTMETATRGVFIAGVLASGLDANKIFIENGRVHGPMIAQALLERRDFTA